MKTKHVLFAKVEQSSLCRPNVPLERLQFDLLTDRLYTLEPVRFGLARPFAPKPIRLLFRVVAYFCLSIASFFNDPGSFVLVAKLRWSVAVGVSPPKELFCGGLNPFP